MSKPDVLPGQVWETKVSGPFRVVWRNSRYAVGVDASRPDHALPERYAIEDFRNYTLYTDLGPNATGAEDMSRYTDDELIIIAGGGDPHAGMDERD